MPTISGNEIENLITLFNNRGLKFYHACQYKDFKTYINLGGVPSRNLMENSGLPFTPFDTDDADRNNSVWNKVFGNLQDFGFGFAQGQRNPNTAPTPNPYGPVLLIFNPEVFREAVDVAICLRSAGGRNFDREQEALESADEVNRIFSYENIDDAPNDYAKAYIKRRDELQQTFGDPEAMTPEVSCIVENEKLSFLHLDKIIVDPYVFNGLNLKDKVNEIKRNNHLNGVVWARLYKRGETRMEMKQELANLLLDNFVSIPQLIQNEILSENLRDYASRIQRGEMTFFYNRFARYLRTGTILELNGEGNQNNPIIEDDDLPW